LLRASNVIQIGSRHFERICTVAEDAHEWAYSFTQAMCRSSFTSVPARKEFAEPARERWQDQRANERRVIVSLSASSRVHRRSPV
jgi:long-subunit acyl-CoA synthetase (AMP-forming)